MSTSIGEKIRAARKSKGLTQVQLAEKMGLKTGFIIGAWERGVRTPKHGSLQRIARALEVPISLFIPNDLDLAVENGIDIAFFTLSGCLSRLDEIGNLVRLSDDALKVHGLTLLGVMNRIHMLSIEAAEILNASQRDH